MKKADKEKLIWLIVVLACFGALVLAAPLLRDYGRKTAINKKEAAAAKKEEAAARTARNEEAAAVRESRKRLDRILSRYTEGEAYPRRSTSEERGEYIDKWRARKIVKVDRSTTPPSVSYLEGGTIQVERVHHEELEIIEHVLRTGQ